MMYIVQSLGCSATIKSDRHDVRTEKTALEHRPYECKRHAVAVRGTSSSTSSYHPVAAPSGDSCRRVDWRFYLDIGPSQQARWLLRRRTEGLQHYRRHQRVNRLCQLVKVWPEVVAARANTRAIDPSLCLELHCEEPVPQSSPPRMSMASACFSPGK